MTHQRMMDDYDNLSASDIVGLIRDRAVTAGQITEIALKRATTTGKILNAILVVCRDRALEQAERVDRRIKRGEETPILAGVPVILKDNIVYSNYPTTCASKILENYVSPYDASCVEKLERAGAVIIGKANMDEFGMGSSNEYSAFGPVINPVGGGLVPGGSSGGSCAVVAGGVVPVALGSDTGGSVRQPASFCGVVGMKPSYGAVSRYGLVAFASSTDQIGPIGRNVSDCARVFQVIAGKDDRDATSVKSEISDYTTSLNDTGTKFSFAVPREFMGEGIDPEVAAAINSATEALAGDGHRIAEVNLPRLELATSAYYMIGNAEASSNLARFDGVGYGMSKGRDGEMVDMYRATRGAGFGREVKRRIMLGTFVLSATYCEQYYQKALQVRELIRSDFSKLFEKIDFILSPASPTAAFRFGEKLEDPVSMYMSDICTIPASLAGLPAISIPCGYTADERPIGLQIMAPYLREDRLFRAAFRIEKLLEDINAHR